MSKANGGRKSLRLRSIYAIVSKGNCWDFDCCRRVDAGDMFDSSYRRYTKSIATKSLFVLAPSAVAFDFILESKLPT